MTNHQNLCKEWENSNFEIVSACPGAIFLE